MGFVKFIKFFIDLSLRVSDLVVDPVFFIWPEVPRSIELFTISARICNSLMEAYNLGLSESL